MEQRFDTGGPDESQIVQDTSKYNEPEVDPLPQEEEKELEPEPDISAMDLSQTLAKEGLSMSPEGKINLPEPDAQNHEMIVLQYEQVLQSVNKEFQKLLNRNKELEEEQTQHEIKLEQALQHGKASELHSQEKASLVNEIQKL